MHFPTYSNFRFCTTSRQKFLCISQTSCSIVKRIKSGTDGFPTEISTFGKLRSWVWPNQHLTAVQVKVASIWLACSACCSAAVKPGQCTNTMKKRSMRSFSAVCDLSSSLGVTVHQILPFSRELVSQIQSYSIEWTNMDSVGVGMCAEWKIVNFRRTPVDRQVLPLDLSFATNSATRMYWKGIWRNFI